MNVQGRIVEIYGKEASGKSTLADHHVRHFGAEADVASSIHIRIYTQSWFGLTSSPILMLIF